MEQPEDVEGQIQGTETADEERDDEMTAELTGWRHESVLVEGREREYRRWWKEIENSYG